jgi:hypothetical protein
VPGALFCDGQATFLKVHRLSLRVCLSGHIVRLFAPRQPVEEQRTSPWTKFVVARGMGRNMTTPETSNSPAERKRARRHKVARRLYEQLVAQNPHRLITLRDGAGKVVAKHDPRPEQDAPEIAS